MFHVEQCDRPKPGWGGNPKASQIYINPAVWVSRWGFAHHHTPARFDQTHGPLQGLQWGTNASGAGSIKGMSEAVLIPQYLYVTTDHFNLVLDPQ